MLTIFVVVVALKMKVEEVLKIKKTYPVIESKGFFISEEEVIIKYRN